MSQRRPDPHPHDAALKALDAIAPDAAGRNVAALIVDALLSASPPAASPPRFILAVEHDAKRGPCPVTADRTWPRTKLASRDCNTPQEAREWLMVALLMGMTATRLDFRGKTDPGLRVWESFSIAKVRERAVRAQAPQPTITDDDEIPF